MKFGGKRRTEEDFPAHFVKESTGCVETWTAAKRSRRFPIETFFLGFLSSFTAIQD